MLMISANEALEYLFNDTNYNFREFLQEVSTCSSMGSAQVQLIINTVELFAFGDLSHYVKYQEKFIQLPPEALRKLAKLTIISFCNENEGGTVPFDVLLEALKPALPDVSSKDCQEILENVLISMIDEKLIAAQIDERSQRVEFVNSNIRRDAYNSSTYVLRVLDEQHDIPKRSVTTARNILQRWLDEQIVPARQQLQETS